MKTLQEAGKKAIVSDDANRTVRTGRFAFVLAVLAGVCAGTSSSVLMGKWHADRLAANERALRQRLDEWKAENRWRPQPILGSENRLSSASPVGNTAEQLVQNSTRDPSAREKKADPMARRNRVAELRALDEEKIRKHWSDFRDEPWSAMATPLLQSGLAAAAAKATFNVKEVDCRSTSCVASVEWSNADDATREYAGLVHTPFEINCARGITLPEMRNPCTGPLLAAELLGGMRWAFGGGQRDDRSLAAPNDDSTKCFDEPSPSHPIHAR